MLTPAVADRVLETTVTTGTGTASLDGAVSRYRGFVATLGDNREVEYTIVHRSANEWEVGVGTCLSGTPDTLTRMRVKSSSNSNALVNFSAGTKDVFIARPAQRGTTVASAFLAASL
jgi:hypothetical protein